MEEGKHSSTYQREPDFRKQRSERQWTVNSDSLFNQSWNKENYGKSYRMSGMLAGKSSSSNSSSLYLRHNTVIATKPTFVKRHHILIKTRVSMIDHSALLHLCSSAQEKVKGNRTEKKNGNKQRTMEDLRLQTDRAIHRDPQKSNLHSPPSPLTKSHLAFWIQCSKTRWPLDSRLYCWTWGAWKQSFAVSPQNSSSVESIRQRVLSKCTHRIKEV